jgi:AraC family transcriptional regulator
MNSRKIFSLLVLTICCSPCWPQTPDFPSSMGYPLGGGYRRGPPIGWFVAGNATEAYHFSTDTAQGLAVGKRSAHIARPGALSSSIAPYERVPPDKFATVMQSISAADYRGKRISLSAQMTTLEVTGKAQLWMRIDGQNGQVLGFDNMESRPITGSKNWAKYSIVLDVPPASTAISFGFLLAGQGDVGAADFNLATVDTTIATTASAPPEGGHTLPNGPTNLDLSQM